MCVALQGGKTFSKIELKNAYNHYQLFPQDTEMFRMSKVKIEQVQ